MQQKQKDKLNHLKRLEEIVMLNYVGEKEHYYFMRFIGNQFPFEFIRFMKKHDHTTTIQNPITLQPNTPQTNTPADISTQNNSGKADFLRAIKFTKIIC